MSREGFPLFKRKTSMKHVLLCGAACMAAATSSPAFAHDDGSMGPHASDHAPIGVMGDHRHKQGEWMLSYRFMTMDMQGNRDGTTPINAETIATTAPNRFFGAPMMPPTLRVVPLQMTMNAHMVGGMYGLSDRVTLMGMTSYRNLDMDHVTFMGGAGVMQLGNFATEAKGFGDSTVAAIIGLDNGAKKERQINLNIGFSVPTGSNEETDQILTPMGGTPTPRLPYPMQLGTGTWDFKPAITAFDRIGKFGFGAQASGRFALSNNEEGYKFSNRVEGTAWLSYEPQYWLSFSTRLKAASQGQIRGIDAAIMAPVQTANPDNSGGETVELLFGVNLAGQSGVLRGHRLALEYGVPLHRDLNGPQLETDTALTLGWQKAF
jgi:hypothetical protein